MDTIHQSVLLKETITSLNINPDGVYVDLTGGGGGHSAAILQHLSSKGKLFIFDQDCAAILRLTKRFAKCNNVEVIHANFADFDTHLQDRNITKVDGIIADLGLSSDQLSDTSRGFSYMNEHSNLDMRMDTLNNDIQGLDVINNESEENLTHIFSYYGECQNARTLSKAIINLRPISDASDLISICDHYKQGKGHSAKKVFQALRAYINDEFGTLKTMLAKASAYLKNQGRLLIITFHSLEDRIVKTYFNSLTKLVIDKNCPVMIEPKLDFKLINNKAIKPSNQEIKDNVRAHSALLRGIEKI